MSENMLAIFAKPPAEVTVQETRAIIADLEKMVREVAATEGEVDMPPKHHFSNGVYAREIHIPKGTIVVGKIHKLQNLNILSKGELSIFSTDGLMRVKAPYTVVSAPGVKRFAYAHEDAVWTTVHGTHETDLEKIEDLFIAKTYDDVVEHEEKKCLG